ncbi:unnamed protein product, partial [Darwinula stevensoni]
MDTVDFAEAPFETIRERFRDFAQDLNFESITAIPLSALRGDNISSRSPHTPWYSGPTLTGFLETVDVSHTEMGHRLVFPVQWVNRPNASFRGFSGTVAQGFVKVGDDIRVTASGQTAKVAEIVTMDGQLQQASSGNAITLRLNKEIDASRGDVLSLTEKPLEMTDQFEATLIWMDQEAGLVGRSYELKLATQWANASITNIKYRVDVNTMLHEAVPKLSLNDICICTLATSKPL